MFASRNRSSDNAQVAHVWAQQTEDRGTAKGGNVFFEGRTIYSYGYHFPMAVFIKGGVLINDSCYSPTTSKHQHYVRQALSNSCKRYYADTTICKIFIQDNVDKKYLKNTLTKYLDNHLENTFEACSRPRIKQTTKAKHASSFANIFNNIKELADLYKVKLPVKFNKAIETLQNDLTSAIAQYEKAVTAARKKQEKARQEEIERKKRISLVAVELWLNGEYLEYKLQDAMQYLDDVYLRVRGDVIETTKGARFPVAEAVKLFPVIVGIIKRGIGYNRKVKDAGLKLGHFTIDNIAPNGDVSAGCHYVKYEQIEPVAKKLNLL